MKDSNVDFIETLVNRFPVVQPLYNENLKDNFGEVLPYLFCSDLTYWMIEFYAQSEGDENKRNQLTALMNFLEDTFRESDEDVETLISLGILENFPSTGEENYNIRNLLGPNLADELQRVNW